MLNDLCQEIDTAFTQIRKFFQEERKRNKGINALLSKDGTIFMESEKKVKRRKKYLEELYNGNLNESVLDKEETLEED